MLSRVVRHARTVAPKTVSSNLGRRWVGGLAAEANDGPTVAEKIVNVVLVDFEGNRHTIEGRVGQTLRQACQMSGNDFIQDDSYGGGGAYDAPRDDYYTESLFGEGATSAQSHVVVSNAWASVLPPPNEQELQVLDYVPEEDRTEYSRLGTEIVLDKSMDGIVFAVPEAPPVETFVYDHQYEDDEVEEHDDDEDEGTV